jgi:fatty acid-binding protein DegV
LDYVTTDLPGAVMQSIAIITDIASSIPFDIAARSNLYQVPMTIHFGEESYAAVYALNDADTFMALKFASEI